MNIVIVNDDGIHAGGILALARALSVRNSVTVIAPDRERSATSHSITLDRPLTSREIVRSDMPGVTFFSVNGTPVDCVHMARALVSSIDLIASGINNGANLGGDIAYSGTVHAALEACAYGIPSVALSLRVAPHLQHRDEEKRYAVAAQMSAAIIENAPMHILGTCVCNINFPTDILGCPPELKVCEQGMSVYQSVFQKQSDPFGREVFWLYAQENPGEYNEVHHTDVYWSNLGYATCTPLLWNSTDVKELPRIAEELRNINLSPSSVADQGHAD